MEIVIALGIVLLLGALSLVSFFNSRRVQNLVTAGNEVLGVVRLAEERALAGDGEDLWGVRLEAGQYYLFRGVSFAGGEVIQSYTLPSGIEIADVPPAWGQEIVFNRVDGTTGQEGSFTVRVQGSATQVFSITVDRSGRVYQSGTAPAPTGARSVDTRHRTFAFSWGIDDATDVRFTFDDGADVRTVVMAPIAPRASYDSEELTFTVGGFNQTMRVHALAVNSTTLSIDRDCRKNTKKVTIAIRDADALWKNIATYEADCRTVAPDPLYGGVMTEP